MLIKSTFKKKEHSLQRTFHRCFIPSFGSFPQVVSEEKIFKNRQYLYRELHFEYIYLYLNKSYLSFNRDVLEINQSEKRIACGWPCLLSDLDKMSILYRGPFIDASYQVSVHFTSGYRGEDF